jgi:hypothetical protein
MYIFEWHQKWAEWNRVWKDDDCKFDDLPLCVDCSDEVAPELILKVPGSRNTNLGPHYEHKTRCFNCGKLMRHRQFHRDEFVNCFCSLACKEVVLARRRLKKEQKKRRTEGVICVSCQRLFVPKRGDAVTCSSACRQKLYRLRALQIKEC